MKNLFQPVLLLFAVVRPDDDGAGIFSLIFGTGFMILWLLTFALIFISYWKVFEKAGKPGWAGIVPIYNIIVLCEIVGRPTWWVILYLIPCVSLVAHVIISLDLAKSFGKDVGYGIGLAIVPWLFYPMLAFGDAKYEGPKSGVNI